MKRKIKYRNASISIDCEKPSKCEVCERTGKLDFHHWTYQFSTDEVKKNHSLVLRNTSVLCFTCHQAANALENLNNWTKKNTKFESKLWDLAAKYL